jgi:hypothetical protein
MADNFDKRINHLIFALLIMITFAIYWQVWDFEFVNYDDDVYVLDNVYVKSGLMPITIKWAFTTTHASLYQPLVWISYMFESDLGKFVSLILGDEIGKNNAGIFHLTNVILHLANTLLLFVLLNRMTGYRWRSAFVAALFAVHPLHVESVAWVAERKDVLSTLFWMLTTLAYVSFALHKSKRSYTLAILFFLLGLLSKPMLVTLPFTLLLFDYWPLMRFPKLSVRRLILEKVPMFILALVIAGATIFAMKSRGSLGSFEAYPLGVRIANSIVAHVFYIAKTFWPSDLAVVYPHPGNTLPVWHVIGSAFLLLGISAAALLLFRIRPYLIVGWLWYLITLAPVNGVIQQGKNAVTDHFSYVPLIGIFIMIAWGVPDLLRGILRTSEDNRQINIALSVSGVLAVAALMVPAYIQVGYWRNSITLFSHAIKVTKGNSLAHNNLGNALLEKGDAELAITHFKEALKYHPEYTDAAYNLGNALYELGDIEGAIRQYRKVIKEVPQYTKARNNLGSILAQQGKFDEAIEQFEAVLRIDPNNQTARQNLENAKLEKAGEL